MLTSSAYRSSGIDVTREGDRWVLRDIIPGTRAEELDIRVGDALLEVDGVDTAPLKLQEVGELIYDGDTVSVVLERDSRRREFVLPVAALVE